MSAPPPDGAAPAGAARQIAACAVCGKPRDGRFKPFCSKRCADVDLGRWLKGSYAIPAVEAPDPAAGGGEDGPD
ncbi:MAG: DNA gyrase inhibitor YacG [Rhizomicrobium sp.]